MMYNIDKKELEEDLKKQMTINGKISNRFYHSLEVVKMALKINQTLNLKIDEDKIYVAALLHDAAKLLSDDELLEILKNNLSADVVLSLIRFSPIWHSYAGKFYVRDKYKITDEEILDAIFYHTTGKPHMTTLEMIIFASDYCEASRATKWADTARNICLKDLEYGVYIILKQTIEYLKENNKEVYALTLDAYEYYKNKVGKND